MVVEWPLSDVEKRGVCWGDVLELSSCWREVSKIEIDVRFRISLSVGFVCGAV